MESKEVRNWGEVVELDAEKTGPIVFHFRPTKYMKVAPENLHAWEAMFAKHVGLPPNKKHLKSLNPAIWSRDPRETISGSGDDWDDCDY